MKYLLVQPPWPVRNRISKAAKYFPWPLIKIGGWLRSQRHQVSLVVGNGDAVDIGFTPDEIWVTTVFSYHFDIVIDTVRTYHFLFPHSKIRIGGVHATLFPDVYRKQVPFAELHVGKLPEAERAEPAFDLMPVSRTQILRMSEGCIRTCPFCAAWKLEQYKPYAWSEIVPKIRYNSLILEDNNFIANPETEAILKKLATHKVNGRCISSIEIEGGIDIRILHRNLHLIPRMKDAKVDTIRLAFDGDLKSMAPMMETCLEELAKYYNLRKDVTSYMLYNHEQLSFEEIAEKLRLYSKWRISLVHSRYRPLDRLSDGYVQQARSQPEGSYYLAPGWTDRRVRVIGSLASDISKMARLNRPTLDDVRLYQGKPRFEETLQAA